MELKENNAETIWYKKVAYEDAKELVKENLVNTVAAFIASGYWLKYIRDSREYEKDGYQSLWECAEKEFGLKISEASRAMSMNDKYSMDGNSPVMIESYKRYSKSQLQEMLTMTDEQIGQVTPDMTVKDIREIKSPKAEDIEKKQERLESFIYDFVWAAYPKLDDSFPEAAGISIKSLKEIFDGKLGSSELIYFIMLGEEESEFVDEDTGEILEKYVSNTVVELVLAYFIQMREGKSQPIPPKVKGLMDDAYCITCGTPLNSPNTEHMSVSCPRCRQAIDWAEYIKKHCDIATNSVNTECGEESGTEIFAEIEVLPEPEEPIDIEFDTEELLKELEDVADMECLGVEAAVQSESDAQEADMEGKNRQEEPPAAGQPPLPKFKNNLERRQWLEDMDAWGLWYEDENIQARYYKYDFPDGSRLIGVQYRYTAPPWHKEESPYKEFDGSYKDTHYHMIYSAAYKEKHEYEYENFYTNATVSIHTLVDFVKEIGEGHKDE